MRSLTLIALAALSLGLFSGCTTASGAATGALTGGLLGAGIGAIAGDPTAGALIGTGIGMGGGAMIGHRNETRQAEQRTSNRYPEQGYQQVRQPAPSVHYTETSRNAPSPQYDPQPVAQAGPTPTASNGESYDYVFERRVEERVRHEPAGF